MPITKPETRWDMVNGFSLNMKALTAYPNGCWCSADIRSNVKNNYWSCFGGQKDLTEVCIWGISKYLESLRVNANWRVVICQGICKLFQPNRWWDSVIARLFFKLVELLLSWKVKSNFLVVGFDTSWPGGKPRKKPTQRRDSSHVYWREKRIKKPTNERAAWG